MVDNRQPTNVPHWPPFCAWWTSRRELKGPAEEATDIVWITATDQLDTIPYYWTGPLLLSIARWMFPSCHIALIDNDCVPLALFEMQDLLKLSQQLPEWRSLLEDSPELPPQIGMILVTEPHFEHNAGLVISPASERMAPDLTLPVEQLNDHFQACLTDFLSSSKPPTDPTEAATSGLLHTPLLGVPCTDTLHHCLAWATLGIYMIHTMWPPPRRHLGRNGLQDRAPSALRRKHKNEIRQSPCGHEPLSNKDALQSYHQWKGQVESSHCPAINSSKLPTSHTRLKTCEPLSCMHMDPTKKLLH